MGEDKSTHFLEMRRQRRSLRTASTDEGGQRHTLARDEEIKGGLRTANTDWGRQRHSLARNEETKGGSEDSKHR